MKEYFKEVFSNSINLFGNKQTNKQNPKTTKDNLQLHPQL